MPLTQLVAATALPLTLDDLKLHARVTSGTDEDDLLDRILRAAVGKAENLTGRSLMTQQWQLTLDEFPPGPIRLGRPPIASIEYVSYRRASDGAWVDLSPSTYELDDKTLPGFVVCGTSYDWPTDVLDAAGAVRVQFTAGYADAASVPDDIKTWVLCAATELYDQRGITATDWRDKPNSFIDSLLDGYVVPRL